MREQRIFAVGDIHGCFNKLAGLLKRLPFDKDRDILVFLGDYLNRGPDSKKVIDTLVELKATCNQAVFLKGNHEHAVLEYAATGDVESLRNLRMMGAEATAESYGCPLRQLQGLASFPPEHREFLHTLDFSFIAGRHLFVHADINDEMIGLGRSNHDLTDRQYHTEAGLLSSRRMAGENEKVEGFVVVFGHLPFESPLVTPTRVGIDTGAVYGNVLTAVELPRLHFHHC